MFTSFILKIVRLFIATSFFYSCTSTGIKITGQYNSKETYLNSKLFIKDDKSFYYINDGLLLYLEGKNYYYTMGSWTKYNDTLYLNSYSDSIIKDSISTIDSKTGGSKSSFTFFSSEGDTLSFDRVDKNGRLFVAIIHSKYKSQEFDVSQGDTLTFWLSYGYSPVTIIISKSENRNYNICVRRKFLSGHFSNTKFLIKRNKLVEMITKKKYIKIKTGM